MRALFSGGRAKEKNLKKREKKKKRKRPDNSRRDYVALSRASPSRLAGENPRRWRRRYDADFPRVCLDTRRRREEARAGEAQRETAGKEEGKRWTRATSRECRRKARFTSHRRSGICSEMIPRCLIAQADIIPRAGKRDDFKQRKPPGEA